MKKIIQNTFLFIVILCLSTCVQNSLQNNKENNYLPPRSEQTLEDAEYFINAAEQEKKIKFKNILLIKSAFVFIKNGKHDIAKDALSKIDTKNLNKSLFVIHTTQKAEILLKQQNPKGALKILNGISDTSTLSKEALAILAETKAKTYYKNTQYFNSVSERSFLNTLKLSQEDKKNNNKLIWETLNLISIDENKVKRQGLIDKNLLAWMELSSLAKESQHDLELQQKQLNKWLKLNPTHDASKELPESLKKIKFALKNRPKKIAILLPAEGPLAKSADAIKQGFLNSYYRSLEKKSFTPELIFFNTSDGALEAEYQRLKNSELLAAPEKTSQESQIFSQPNSQPKEASKDRKEKAFLAIYNQAIDAEADLVVGPINKTYIRALTLENIKTIPTLALNYIDESYATKHFNNNHDIFKFGLSPEDEIVLLSDQARLRDYTNVAILAPSDTLGNRLSSSFSSHWQATGGKVINISFYDDTKGLTKIIEKMLQIDKSEKRFKRIYGYSGNATLFHSRRRDDIDFIFLISKPEMGRQIIPTFAFHKASDLPVMSTSHIYEGKYNPKDKDLNRVIFPVIPSILNKDAHNNKAWQAQQLRYRPLISMGTDTYSLSNMLPILKSSGDYKIHGETGILSIGKHLRINRKPALAKFNGSQVQAELVILEKESGE